MRIGHTNSDYSGSRLAGEEIEKESVCIILVTSIQLSMYFPLQYQAQSRTACPGHTKFVLDTREAWVSWNRGVRNRPNFCTIFQISGFEVKGRFQDSKIPLKIPKILYEIPGRCGPFHWWNWTHNYICSTILSFIPFCESIITENN